MKGREACFTTMQVRETAKQPNFLWAAVGKVRTGPARGPMDIVHAGYDVQTLLRDDNPVLPRLCILGPVRHTKNAFLAECLRSWAPTPPRYVLATGAHQ